MARRKLSPALTDEARETQLVSLAQDLAERQLLDGTASSQVITHFLKTGSYRERLERERLMRENELLQARVKSLASAEKIEVMYEEALKAMKSYQGQDPNELEEFYED